jgi:hypothetical protein
MSQLGKHRPTFLCHCFSFFFWRWQPAQLSTPIREKPKLTRHVYEYIDYHCGGTIAIANLIGMYMHVHCARKSSVCGHLRYIPVRVVVYY